MRIAIVLLLASAVGCMTQESSPPRDPELVVRVRSEQWTARPTGRFHVQDPLDTETPEGETSPTVTWAQDLDLNRPRNGVRSLDLAVMEHSDDGTFAGPRIVIRRGRWKSESVLDEDEDLGTLVIPRGSPVEAELQHEFYAGGVCLELGSEAGFRGWSTMGVGITRNTTHARFPQGSERRIQGGGLFWLDLEAEYAPVPWIFVRGHAGILYFPFAGGTVDAGGDVGARWGGVSLTTGFRLFKVLGLRLSGPTFGLQIDF